MARQFYDTLVLFKSTNDFLTRGTLFREERCCKLMLKHDIRNYFRQFTNTLSSCSQ